MIVGRNDDVFLDIVGLFVNILVLCINILGDLSFKELLNRVK